MATKAEKETGARVRSKLFSSLEFLELSIITLYDKQEADEQRHKLTHWDNNRGYNKPDAHILTDYSIWILNGKHLIGEYVDEAAERMAKYSIQLGRYDHVIRCLDGMPCSEFIATYQLRLPREPIPRDEVTGEEVTIQDFLRLRKERRDLMAKIRGKVRRGTAWIIKASISRESEKAYLLDIGDARCWIPKSQMLNTFRKDVKGAQEIGIKRWVAEENGLVAPRQVATFIKESDSGKAVLFDIEGTECWIPKSAILSNYEEDTKAKQYLDVKKWIFDKIGLDQAPR